MNTHQKSKQIVTESLSEMGLLDEGIVSGIKDAVKKIAVKIADSASKSDIVKYVKYHFSGERKMDMKMIENISAEIEKIKANPQSYKHWNSRRKWYDHVHELNRKKWSLESKGEELSTNLQDTIVDILWLVWLMSMGVASAAAIMSS